MTQTIFESKVNGEKKLIFSIDEFHSPVRYFLLRRDRKKTIYKENVEKFIEHIKKRGLDYDDEAYGHTVEDILPLFENLLKDTDWENEEILGIELNSYE